jgi:hypothetical protein
MTKEGQTGSFGTPCQVLVHLKFEGFPIWLLTLDATLVNKVCITGMATQAVFFSTMREQGFNPDLICVAIHNICLHKVAFSALPSTPPAEAIMLVSGSLGVVKNWNPKGPDPTLVLCDKHVHNK